MAAAREVELDCEESFALAAARVVEVRAEEVFEHSDGVLDLGEIERVHDMRVATRRLRAALEVFEPCFPRKRYRKALKQVKALADALGERRDRDVEIELARGLRRAGGGGDRGALLALIEELRMRQGEANEALAPYVAAEAAEEAARRLTSSSRRLARRPARAAS